jgi:HAD superfamily hydrolase (TIGR01549 family)
MSLREKTPDTKWFIVSGGAEDELRKVFSNRSIKDMFDGGIYGSPKTKDQILNSLKKENQLKFPALFLGDSRYDYEAAQRANLDFTFVCEWTEFKDWRSFCQRMKIPHIGSLCDLL